MHAGMEAAVPDRDGVVLEEDALVLVVQRWQGLEDGRGVDQCRGHQCANPSRGLVIHRGGADRSDERLEREARHLDGPPG